MQTIEPTHACLDAGCANRVPASSETGRCSEHGLSLINGRYQGRLADGRLLCVLPGTFDMNWHLPTVELYDPNEWLSSVDGANCWVEEMS